MITREDLEKAKATIERLAGLSAQEHFDETYDTGVRWLDKSLGSLNSWKQQFITSPVFWAWWRQQWDLRNYSIYKELGLKDIDSLTRNEQIGLQELMSIKHRACFEVRPARVLIDKIRNEGTSCKLAPAGVVGHKTQPQDKQGVNKLR
jgi:hypothetical protein